MIRRKPMARTPFQAKPPKPRRTAPPKVRATPRPKLIPDALAKIHMGRVAELGCCICGRPAEVHHCRSYAGGWGKASDYHTIPLCPICHRLGGSGVAIHAGIQTWQRIHGTEAYHLAQTLRMLGFCVSDDDLERRDLGVLLYARDDAEMALRT